MYILTCMCVIIYDIAGLYSCLRVLFHISSMIHLCVLIIVYICNQILGITSDLYELLKPMYPIALFYCNCDLHGRVHHSTYFKCR